jgi:hypothetical protein
MLGVDPDLAAVNVDQLAEGVPVLIGLIFLCKFKIVNVGKTRNVDRTLEALELKFHQIISLSSIVARFFI